MADTFSSQPWCSETCKKDKLGLQYFTDFPKTMEIPRTISTSQRCAATMDHSEITLPEMDVSDAQLHCRLATVRKQENPVCDCCSHQSLRWQAVSVCSHHSLPQRQLPKRTKSTSDQAPTMPSSRGIRRNNSWRPPRYPKRSRPVLISTTPKAA